MRRITAAPRVAARLAGLLLARLEFRAVEQLVNGLLARRPVLGIQGDREAGGFGDLGVSRIGDRPDLLHLVIGQLETLGQRRAGIGHRVHRPAVAPGEGE